MFQLDGATETTKSYPFPFQVRKLRYKEVRLAFVKCLLGFGYRFTPDYVSCCPIFQQFYKTG